MKKLIVFISLLLTLAFSATCLAGENGNALSKEEKAATTVISALTAKDSKDYAKAVKFMSPQLSTKMNINTFIALQKQVREKMGSLKELSFVSFERFEKDDTVTYLAVFTLEENVELTFTFDKNNKVTEFTLTPLAVEEVEE